MRIVVGDGLRVPLTGGIAWLMEPGFLEERANLAPGDPWFERLRDAYLVLRRAISQTA